MKRLAAGLFCSALIVTVLGFWQTHAALKQLPSMLPPAKAEIARVQVRDRVGSLLSQSYSNRWNSFEQIPLHQVPHLLQRAFIVAEDKNFFSHSGVDWSARIAAVVQNLKALRVVRGASTISEQIVRMLHPRARTPWSRWLEGFEAKTLSEQFSKAELLEFYLNQVPYGGKRRGILQASQYYFGRDLSTLSNKEMLALAVLVRAPSALDPRKNLARLERSIENLGARMVQAGALTEEQFTSLCNGKLDSVPRSESIEVAHFVQFVRAKHQSKSSPILHSTLDSQLQGRAQRMLDQRIRDLAAQNVRDGAVLVVNHRTNEVLAWVNGGSYFNETPGSTIDAILTPRQPGSTLKPFLYALALEKGWTPATLLNDAPHAQGVRTGLHTYRNYSGTFYGPVRLRVALGNSLNIPAILAAEHVGANAFLARLRALGFQSLQESAEFYGEGLALGNGEVTLWELVQGYASLARMGTHRPLRTNLFQQIHEAETQVFDKEVSSLIAHILSDPEARSLEFGRGHLLQLPVQTAVKTGTSNAYRDAWALGFSHTYTVGVWLGNLDGSVMQGVSGSIGPAILLRSVFADLHRNVETQALGMSRALVKHSICKENGLRSDGNCESIDEWFRPKNKPKQAIPTTQKPPASPYISQPTPRLHLASDPRIPDELERFPFALQSPKDIRLVHWLVNGEHIGTSRTSQFSWPLSKGEHRVQAKVWSEGEETYYQTKAVSFVVK